MTVSVLVQKSAPKTMGEKIRETRIEKGYSIEKLALDAEISYTYLHELEVSKKKNVSAPVLFRIARELERPMEYFMDEQLTQATLRQEAEGLVVKIARLNQTDQKRIRKIIEDWLE